VETEEFVGRLTGVRLCALGQTSLRSITAPYVWTMGINTASCVHGAAFIQPSCVHERGLCYKGFRAAKDVQSLVTACVHMRNVQHRHLIAQWHRELTRGLGFMLGEVSLSGEVVEHEFGYAAEQAEVTALYTIPYRHMLSYGSVWYGSYSSSPTDSATDEINAVIERIAENYKVPAVPIIEAPGW
jgi:hypothetical protein